MILPLRYVSSSVVHGAIASAKFYQSESTPIFSHLSFNLFDTILIVVVPVTIPKLDQAQVYFSSSRLMSFTLGASTNLQ